MDANSQIDLPLGLFYGPKYENKIKPNHPDDEDKSYQSLYFIYNKFTGKNHASLRAWSELEFR